jgi:hypothetical protein
MAAIAETLDWFRGEYHARYLRYVQEHRLDPYDEEGNWSQWKQDEMRNIEWDELVEKRAARGKGPYDYPTTDEDEEDEGDEGDEDEDEEPTTKRQKFNPFFDRDCELCSDQSSTQINKQCAYCIFCKSPMCSSCECTCPRAIRSLRGESYIISL